MRSAVLGGDNIGFLFRVHGQEFHSFRRTRGSKNLREFPLRPSETFPAANGTLDFAFNTLKSKIGLLTVLSQWKTVAGYKRICARRRRPSTYFCMKAPTTDSSHTHARSIGLTMRSLRGGEQPNSYSAN